MTEPFKVIAKAGGALEHPENTCEAFAAMADLASRTAEYEVAVEVDVRVTRDGVPVAFHDASVERTAEGIGRTAAFTLGELKRLRLRSCDQRIPTLPEVFEAAGPCSLVLELHDDRREALDAVVRCLQRLSAADRSRALVASASTRAVRAVRAGMPAVATAATAPEVLSALLLAGARLPSISRSRRIWIVPERRGALTVVTPRFVERAGRRGEPVLTWVINDPEHTQRLRTMGVAGVFTECPGALLASLATQGAGDCAGRPASGVAPR